MKIVLTVVKIVGTVIGVLVTASTIVLAAAFSVVVAEIKDEHDDDVDPDEDVEIDSLHSECTRVNRSHGYVPNLPIS